MDGGNSTLAAHGRLDKERQSKDSRSMHGIMTSRRNSADASSTFQQFHHVLPRLMYLRQVMCPSCFPLSQMKNLGTAIELDPKGHNITCPAFGLHSSLAEHSTVGHTVLDLTNLAYQPTTNRVNYLVTPRDM